MMEDEDREDGESVLSEDNEPVEVQQETDDFSLCRNMPWVRVSSWNRFSEKLNCYNYCENASHKHNETN